MDPHIAALKALETRRLSKKQKSIDPKAELIIESLMTKRREDALKAWETKRQQNKVS